jgi:predicted transcriptional regulator
VKIKHSKYKNTGILFELLVRQIASDTVSGKDSAAINLIRKYFSKSELAKEHKLYQALVGSKALTEGKAESLINATLEISSRLNRSALRKEKYNIIKDIRESYDLEDFFKSKINNYSQYAAAFNLIEAHNSLEFIEPSQVIENKVNLLEHITRKEVNKEDVKDRVMEEYLSMDKGTRILVYRTLLERFNSKYSNMSNTQKSVLKEYINNISNTVKLREFVNNHFAAIKAELNRMNKTVTDKTTQIKINEVVNILKPLDKNQNVKDDNIMALLQFHQLIAELKLVK